MSISFKTIKGFNNKVNLGDSSYNTNVSFNKNNIVSDGNPRNWGGNHNIEKTKGISAHTRYIEKVGTEVISNLNRNEEKFMDRMTQNISLYPKSQNIMATGIDYGGSTPYKIGFNGQGSAAASCQLNISDYVQKPSSEHALSRMPVKYVTTFTNKGYSGGKQMMGNDHLKPMNNLKSIKDEYINPSISVNKTQKNVNTNAKPDLKPVSSSISSKLQGSVFVNKNVQNPYNNNQKTNDKLPINENYKIISYSTNKNDKNVIVDNHRNVDTQHHIKYGTPLLGHVETNKIGRDYSTNHNEVVLEKDKLNISANTNKIGKYTKEDYNRDVELTQEKMNISANTNIKKNSNEAETFRFKPHLQETTPNANVTTNIYKRSNHLDNQQRPRNVRLQETLNVNNHYHNNNVGPRSQTKNLRFNL